MQHLPISIQTFENLRVNKYLYVDKTKQIYSLLQKESAVYFLSRPRRFGKSLTISTLQAIFEGKKHLFEGLWIEDKIDWQPHPIIHLDFGLISFHGLGLAEALNQSVEEHAKKYSLILTTTDLRGKFIELIIKLGEKSKVVILIDEYDKPLVQYLESDQLHKAEENREVMKNFYGVLKSLDNYLRMVFITGVSRFSKVSLFSDLNHLFDLSLQPNANDLVGYTQAELEHYFTDYLEVTSEKMKLSKEALLAKIKYWYNGYSWNGQETVYNPFSTLLFFENQDFQNFWFATGTPTLLIKLMRKESIIDFKDIYLNSTDLQNYQVSDLGVSLYSLLFQTGYLTITESLGEGNYLLNYPNKEVEDSLSLILLNTYLQTAQSGISFAIKFKNALLKLDIEGFIKVFKSMFASIPYHLFIADREAYYHTVIYLVMKLLGLKTEVEETTNLGRIDAVIFTEKAIFVCEFKLSDAEKAIFQIKQRKYWEKYLTEGKDIYLLGIVFSAEERNIKEYIWEKTNT